MSSVRVLTYSDHDEVYAVLMVEEDKHGIFAVRRAIIDRQVAEIPLEELMEDMKSYKESVYEPPNKPMKEQVTIINSFMDDLKTNSTMMELNPLYISSHGGDSIIIKRVEERVDIQ
jgi:hypothetical protein